ncbi:hypothetical protein D9619_008731 [Psilocybe cf. subviscida]|uniref:Uncharacterized protein n=1 Tax=Psilocybe cf. subviscida TaxID=2480587 RepID=A0A8H5F0U2_9AGAR|nr:hypothetical protein D9619_008731 [Psilocybe cf. subviscida]
MKTKQPLPFAEPVITDADKKKMEEVKRSVSRVEVISELGQIKRLDPVYNQRRQFIKTIPKFWPTALFRHAGLAMDLKIEEDIKALQYITDIWVERNPVEPRVYTIQFTFSKNPYFEDKVLQKVYRCNEKPGSRNEPADKEGFKWSMLDFDWDRDVKALASSIHWKPRKNLCQQYPKEVDEDGDVMELGSFFNWFESDGDAFDIGLLISDEIFPDAINYFNGEVDDDDDNDNDDSEGEDSEEDGNKGKDDEDDDDEDAIAL